MKYPSRHAHESLEDWESACLRHEEHAESQRELWHEREAERIAGLETDNPDPVAVVDTGMGDWEAYNEENFRTELCK